MELPKKLLSAASTDKARELLHGAFVDGQDRTIVCTDGKAMATIPIEGDFPIASGHITPTVWKMAKVKDAKTFVLDLTLGTLNGVKLESTDEVGNYPNWKAAMPNYDPSYRAYFNPELIAKASESLGYNPGDSVCFEFDHSGQAPLKMHYKGRVGVVMPMRGIEEKCGVLKSSDKNADALRKENESLRQQIKELSERSHNPTTTDDSLVDALKAELAETRAQVKQLESAAVNQNPEAKKPKNASAKPATERPTISRNDEKDGIELRFNGKPNDAIRLQMKAHGFRWLPGKPGQPWAAKYTEERWIFAQHVANGSQYTPMPEDPQPSEQAPTQEPQSQAAISAIRMLDDL